MDVEIVDHVVCLPAHRLCRNDFTLPGEEVAEVQSACGKACALVLLDGSDPEATLRHAVWLQELEARLPGLAILHLRSDDLQRLVRHVTKGRPDLRSALLGVRGIRTGKLVNLAFLVAAAMGAGTLSLREPDQHAALALREELELLGGEEGLSAAGTTVRPYELSGRPDLLAELAQLLGLPPEVAGADFREAACRADATVRIAAGRPIHPQLCTLREVFLHLPVCPADETPGADAFLTSALAAARWRTASRDREVEKESDPTYWLRLRHAIDHAALYRPVLESLEAARPATPQALVEASRRAVSARLAAASPDRPRRADLQRRYASLLAGFRESAAAAGPVRRTISEVLVVQEEAMATHLALLGAWPELVERAATFQL